MTSGAIQTNDHVLAVASDSACRKRAFHRSDGRTTRSFARSRFAHRRSEVGWSIAVSAWRASIKAHQSVFGCGETSAGFFSGSESRLPARDSHFGTAGSRTREVSFVSSRRRRSSHDTAAVSRGDRRVPAAEATASGDNRVKPRLPALASELQDHRAGATRLVD